LILILKFEISIKKMSLNILNFKLKSEDLVTICKEIQNHFDAEVYVGEFTHLTPHRNCYGDGININLIYGEITINGKFLIGINIDNKHNYYQANFFTNLYFDSVDDFKKYKFEKFTNDTFQLEITHQVCYDQKHSQIIDSVDKLNNYFQNEIKEIKNNKYRK